MPLQSLNIDLSNAAICILSCSSAFVKRDLPSSQGFFPGEDKGDREGPLYHLLLLSLENSRWGGGGGGGGGRGGATIIWEISSPLQCCMGIPGRGYTYIKLQEV